MDARHPADGALDELRYKDGEAYEDAEAAIERMIEAFLSAGQTRGGGAGRNRTRPKADTTPGGQARGGGARRFRRSAPVFSGRAWHRVLNDIAEALHAANAKAIEGAAQMQPELFAEAANVTLYTVAGGGYTRGGGAGRDRVLVYTAQVVRALEEAGLIEFGRRVLNQAKDLRYNRRRAQDAANAEALQDGDGLPGRIARRVTGGIRSATEASAQTMLRAAYDSGVYEAGQDLERAGIESEKTWLGIPDRYIRDSHRHLHRTTVPINAVFHGFYGDLRYPHDPEAPLSETMRCRCRLAVHLPGHAPKAYDGSLLPGKAAAYMIWRDAAIARAGAELMEMHIQRRR